MRGLTPDSILVQLVVDAEDGDGHCHCLTEVDSDWGVLARLQQLDQCIDALHQTCVHLSTPCFSLMRSICGALSCNAL